MEELKNDPTKFEQVKEILNSLEDSILKTYLIQDNKYIFIYEDNLYRVKMPSQKEKSEAELVKNKLYMKLLNENTKLPEAERHKSREQLKQVLVSSGVADIDKLEARREELKRELNDLYYELAQKLSDNIEAINDYKDKIQSVKKEFENISVEIANWLVPCIQDQLEKVYVEYLVHSCTEKCIKIEQIDSWERVWKDLKAYQDEASALSDAAASGMIALLYNTIG